MNFIREAMPDDVPTILQLIHDLAVYEKEPDAVRNTVDQLTDALFGPDPKVYAHVAESGGRIEGFALWFLNYSTWEGVHGIYLEDLYVRPGARGAGHGKALLQNLARIAAERGYARVEWSVLKWNAPSIRFYESLGARVQEEWSTFRLTGAALSGFAGTARA
ncbi:GNAT family N-acetyltransferase [Arthrobacter sp. Br18]|uniref:GNAT family N-acetyltransferase n=1 Tax=Arthrobacter sp. Br18 TaxID=1312954 RepID=UPI0004791AD5|nr:GNAT family N-acetyltransferase [Arthrobacter sp. Br18]